MKLHEKVSVNHVTIDEPVLCLSATIGPQSFGQLNTSPVKMNRFLISSKSSYIAIILSSEVIASLRYKVRY